jgi:hypothetical protein
MEHAVRELYIYLRRKFLNCWNVGNGLLFFCPARFGRYHWAKF